MIEALAFLVALILYGVGYLHGRGHRTISALFSDDAQELEVERQLSRDTEEQNRRLGREVDRLRAAVAELRGEIAAVRAENDHDTENMAAEQAFTLGLMRNVLTAGEARYLIEHFQLETFYPELHAKLARIATEAK